MCDGRIEVIFGPMFSGKTSELLRKVRRYIHAKKKCLVINHFSENRYSDEDVISTHDRSTHKAVKTKLLTPLLSQAKNYQVVAIDEGQFFQQIVQFCQELADAGIVVIVAALDGTFERKAFNNIIHLLPIAESVVKLTAICEFCGKEASFSLRIVESKEVELIGGSESYKPVCRKCFKNPPKQ